MGILNTNTVNIGRWVYTHILAQNRDPNFRKYPFVPHLRDPKKRSKTKKVSSGKVYTLHLQHERIQKNSNG